MDLRPARPASLALILLVYLGSLIAIVILVLLIFFAMETLLGWSSESNAMGIVVPMVAGLAAGQFWYGREKARPGSGRVWVAALLCAIVTLVLQGGLVWAALQSGMVSGFPTAAELSQEDRDILRIVIPAVIALELLLIRLGFWLGIRNTAKAAEKLAAKG